MRKNNFKIQMLVGNRLKILVGASFEIILTLGRYMDTKYQTQQYNIHHDVNITYKVHSFNLAKEKDMSKLRQHI